MKSERMSSAARLSYVGSYERITGALSSWRWFIRIPLVIGLIILAWLGVSVWYGVWLLGGFIILLPFRLVGRGFRKRKLEKQRHKELTEVLKENSS